MQNRLPAWAIVCVLALAACQGWYAVALNRSYYEHYPPFFDSMSYWMDQANVLAAAKADGFVAGMKVVQGRSTVTLPWLMTAAFAPWLPYARAVGIAMQELWMAALALSVLAYWRVYRGAGNELAIALVLPTISFGVIYRADGGLSDFRMDLLLYIFYALVMVWYLATRETHARLPWVLSGIAMVLCCWNRATAPAYLGVALGPLLLARFWANAGERAWLAKRVAAYWIPAAALGMAPIVWNWEHIHYYYFVWGWAPTMHLPFWKTWGHLATLGLSVGYPVAAACAIALAIHLRRGWRSLDWALVWTACAPVALLMGTGAGPSPFASMPGAFGGLLFCAWPYRGPVAASRWTAAVLVAACGTAAVAGAYNHQNPAPDMPRMAALKEAVRRMQAESRARGWNQADFETAHLVDFQSLALANVLIYDLGATPLGSGAAQLDGVRFETTGGGPYSAAVPLDWQQLPGTDDAAKLGYLAELARQKANFFFLPDEATIDWAEQHLPHNFINLKMRAVRQAMLASGVWQQVGAPIAVSGHETVEMYANGTLK